MTASELQALRAHPDRYEENRAAARITSGEYRDRAARHEEGFQAAHRRLAHTLRAVDDLFGPAAAEVLRRLFDDLGENAGEAIDNLQHHAGLLRAELDDRRIRETGELRTRAGELAVENARLRQAGRRLLYEVEAGTITGRSAAARRARAAIARWLEEDPR